MAKIMYYAWSKHGIKPSDIYKMSSGELKLLRSFYIIEMESRPRHF
jgi:hypothetical protein